MIARKGKIMAKRDNAIPAIVDFVTPESVGEIRYSAEQMIGKPLYLNQFEIIQMEGKNNSTYQQALMYCTDPEQKREIVVVCSAKVVLEQLNRLPPEVQLPAYLVFRKMGLQTVISK